MKRLILLLALVAATKAFFIRQLIRTYTSPAVEPTVVLESEETPVNYEVNEYSYPNPVLNEIETTDLVHNPLFQNVIRQAVSQGASIDLKDLSSSDYQQLIQIMKISPDQIAAHSPLYIPPVNELPLEQESRFFWPINAFPNAPVSSISTTGSQSESAVNVLPLQQDTRFFWPINVFPSAPVESSVSTTGSQSEAAVNVLPVEQDSRFFWPLNALSTSPVESSISTSESKSESSEEKSSEEVQEPAKEVSSSTVNSSATENTESQSNKEVSAIKEKPKDINQNLELPSENQAIDFNTDGTVTKEKLNSLPADEDFSHSYNLEDGTKVAEKGYVITSKDGSEILAKKGSYEWVDANGKLIKVDWIADENGFRVLE